MQSIVIQNPYSMSPIVGPQSISIFPVQDPTQNHILLLVVGFLESSSSYNSFLAALFYIADPVCVCVKERESACMCTCACTYVYECACMHIGACTCEWRCVHLWRQRSMMVVFYLSPPQVLRQGLTEPRTLCFSYPGWLASPGSSCLSGVTFVFFDANVLHGDLSSSPQS